MTGLRDIQRAFAHAILLGDPSGAAVLIDADDIPASDRLAIYRNTSRSVMTTALRLTFPAVNCLVGDAFFDMVAARFIKCHPPDSACLDDYGADFPDFLRSVPESAYLDYLPDVARFEWALGVAAHAPDVPPPDLLALARMSPESQTNEEPHQLCDLLALARMSPDRHELTRFAPHPSVTLLCLKFPADHIADAVMSGDDAAMAAIDLGAGPVRIAVHRGPDGVAAERLTSDIYSFLVQLFAGEALGELFTRAPEHAAGILRSQFALGRLAGISFAVVPAQGGTIQ